MNNEEKGKSIIRYCLSENIIIDRKILEYFTNSSCQNTEFLFKVIKEISKKFNTNILNGRMLLTYLRSPESSIEDEEGISKIESSFISRTIPRSIRYEVLKRQGWRCNQCNRKLKYDGESQWEGEVAHIDHIYPYSKRESYSNGKENINEPSNLQALCPPCNMLKGKREIQ